ncbi:glycosyltransferase [Candidatus Kaiserbacteria bacterium]|nr:glycosyltransferase [Candidatus Kaiserbacteria bacterium]
MKILPASIVIPTLNEEKYLPLLLGSLRKISAPLDIIVVDGDSADDTVRIVEEYQPHFTGESSLRLVQCGERGISLQRNKGAAIAKHDILIFCDADIIVPSEEAYTKIIFAFKEKGYVVAAPVLVPVESGVFLRHIHRSAYYTQRILLMFKRPYFGGAYLITTKDVFAKLGGFDQQIMLGEDVDYSLRASRLGGYGLIEVALPVSARRMIKYGYTWALKELPNIIRSLWTGRVRPDTIYYPFGAYGGHAAHHVTNNRGKNVQ